MEAHPSDSGRAQGSGSGGMGQPGAQLPHFPAPPTWWPFSSTRVEHQGWNRINNISFRTFNIKVHILRFIDQTILIT